ncbi:MAG: aldehyde dehydrogenase family protein, partial [Sinobacteraceae bacterium]|nr:aldehyde dehydrogenase family protein [Nevskiaceae bacterium]
MDAVVEKSGSVAVEIDPKVAAFLKRTQKNLINGQWVEAVSGKSFDVFNPATGEVLCQAAESDKEDVDRAVKAARKAFEHGPWSKMTPAERARIVWKLGDLIMEHCEEFAQLESLDNGKPISVARVADVPLSAEEFRYMAGWATKLNGANISTSIGTLTPGTSYHVYTRRQPVGVCGQIIPWNFPLLMAAWKLAPALAVGCTLVLKPAEETPLSALRLGELLAEAGVPDGVVNIVTGFGETAGAAIASHPDVNKVAFTGSTEVGKLLLNAASGNLKRLSLELGGKSPNIICDDADIDAAIAGAANGIFFNQGEVCTAGSRLFVHEKVYDRVVEGVSAIAKSMKVGPGMCADTQMGPLVSQVQFDRVTGYLKTGTQEGARATVGGKAVAGKGWFVEPTVLVDT